MFPGLQRLDGHELSKLISFDIEKKEPLPITKGFFTINEEYSHIAKRFLLEYFQVFDSNNREYLINAYHEQASFSMTTSCQLESYKSNEYLQESRNLLQIMNSYKRFKFMKHGNIHIISYITKMPKTEHFAKTFTMDVQLATNQMIMITITGLFKELNGKNEPLRYFNRTFFIMSENNRFTIYNELLHISQPTKEQEIMYSIHKTEIEKPIMDVSLTVEQKQQLVISFSQHSNMNIIWSEKCLEECNWIYDNAIFKFRSCLQNGIIPIEAFDK